MFIDIGRGLVAGLPALALPPAILDAVERGAWIVFNLSGGKDSSAAMFAVNLILDALGHPTTCFNSISNLRRRGKHVQVGLMLGNMCMHGLDGRAPQRVA